MKKYSVLACVLACLGLLFAFEKADWHPDVGDLFLGLIPAAIVTMISFLMGEHQNDFGKKE